MESAVLHVPATGLGTDRGAVSLAFYPGPDDRDGPVFADGQLPFAAIPALGRVRRLPEPDHR